MHKHLVTALLCLAALTSQAEVIYKDSTVRFDLISESAIRLEYAPDGRFVDNRSLIAVNRDYSAVDYKIKDGRDKVVIETAYMALTYRKNRGAFSPDNLEIKSRIKGFDFVWHPGNKQSRNLKGTYNGLDVRDGEFKDGEPMPIEDGVVAFDGWNVIDDSEGLIFDNSDIAWAEERGSAKGAQDLYFMAYGHDYRRALKDYTLFAGKVPLPPRYAFGYWWSRYWSYTDNEFRALADAFEHYDIPVDVMVMDMDWHYIDPGRGGWTGFSWNRELFPEPATFIGEMKARGLHVPLNLHFGGGVGPFEDHYSEMAEAMGVTSGDTIPFAVSSKPYMLSLMDKILRPIEKDGADFWWLDFNTYPNDKTMPKLNNVWWLAHVFFTDMERNRDTRPLTFTRWGGPGAHRYQLGFSGDHCVSWNSLAFQPYFTSTAANTLQGYWSHDIGGHVTLDRLTPEMFVRWMQFGAMSPILRTHSAKDASLNKEPWNYDKEHFDIIRDLIRFRYALAPYIYTLARQTYDDGVAMCRPMYYDYPEAPEAYAMKNEYMFGDRMLMMPITSPMTGVYSKENIWLPGGDSWYELSTGTTLEGGRTVSRDFAIDEFPLYVKSGSVIPMTRNIKKLSANDYPYEINVFPGGNDSTAVYEDNGNDKNYAKEYAFTPVVMCQEGGRITVRILPRQGRYENMPDRRDISVRINGVRPALSAFGCNGALKPVFDGNELTVTVSLGSVDPSEGAEVTIDFGRDDFTVADGMKTRMRRAAKAVSYIKNTNPYLPVHGALSRLESAGRAATYHPDRFDEIAARFNNDFDRLPQVLKDLGYSDELSLRVLEISGYKE